MKRANASSAIFVVPRSSSSWKGAEAIWVTIAGWALAAEKVLGEAVVVTTDRTAKPSEVFNYPIEKNAVTTKRKTLNFLPSFLRIFLKDIILFFQSREKKTTVLHRNDIRFIWEQHDLFAGRGKRLSRKFKVPLVKYVHAPVVWEASKWGVKRYLWGRILEKFETRSLKKADVVLVVSKEVKNKLLEMGVDKEKILISPMGVHPDIFATPPIRSANLKADFQIKNQIVLGWIGSFRVFHGIDQVIEAFSKVALKFPDVSLILVGDGAKKKDAEFLTKQLNVENKVIFTGKRKYREIPAYLSLFDIAIVSAKSAVGFHYSPLKLREYWAAGKSVIAPYAGEISENFKNNVDLKLFTPGDIEDLEKVMIELLTDKDKRSALGSRGKARVLKSGTWEVELKKLLFYLEKLNNDERET